jgi:hypothetical protein
MAGFVLSTNGSHTMTVKCDGASAAAILASLPAPRLGTTHVVVWIEDEEARDAWSLTYAVVAMRSNTRGDSDWYKWVANFAEETPGLQAVVRAAEASRVFVGVNAAVLGAQLVPVALRIVDSAVQGAPQFMYTQRIQRRWAPPNYMDLDTEAETDSVSVRVARTPPRAPLVTPAPLPPHPQHAPSGVTQESDPRDFDQCTIFLFLSLAQPRERERGQPLSHHARNPESRNLAHKCNNHHHHPAHRRNGARGHRAHANLLTPSAHNARHPRTMCTRAAHPRTHAEGGAGDAHHEARRRARDIDTISTYRDTQGMDGMNACQ